MIKKLLLITISLFFGIYSYAQNITNVSFVQKDQTIVVNYDISGKFYQKFNVDLYVSMDGGKTFIGPLEKVTGDVGPNITESNNKTIIWNVIQEKPDFGGNVVFDVKAIVITENIRKKFYVGYKGSLTAPIGLTIGLTGKTGFYLSARMNLEYNASSDFETDGETVTNYYEEGYYVFNQNDKTQRISVTGGLQFQVGRKLHIYGGIGYSIYNLYWEIEKYDYPDIKTGSAWVKHTGESFSGIEAEAGLMFEIKNIYISGGISSPGILWIEPAICAGILF